MFKKELKMIMAVCWSYTKLCISIVKSTILLVDHSVVKVWILVLLYNLTPSFIEVFFSGLKRLMCRYLPIPLHEQDVKQSQFLSRVLQV